MYIGLEVMDDDYNSTEYEWDSLEDFYEAMLNEKGDIPDFGDSIIELHTEDKDVDDWWTFEECALVVDLYEESKKILNSRGKRVVY